MAIITLLYMRGSESNWEGDDKEGISATHYFIEEVQIIMIQSQAIVGPL